MGIFDRLSTLFKSSANAAIDKLSDPGKELDQVVIEMEEELGRARKETLGAMATEKRTRARVAELERAVLQWNERAEAAVRAGDDELAKQALERKAEAEGALTDGKREAQEAATLASEMQTALKQGEEKLRQVKLRKGTIRTKISGAHTSDVRAAALDEFDRMAGKVDDAESQNEADAEIANEVLGDADRAARDAEVAKKFDVLDGKSSDLDARLAELKKKMEKPGE